MSDGAGRTGMFSSLRIRNFRLFFGGQLISQIGNWLTMIAQTLLVLELTDSGIALGLLAACQFGPVLVMSAWTGLIADRSDKRRLLIIVQTGAMVQSFALAIVASADAPKVWMVYVLAIGGGCLTAFDSPTRRAYVVEMVPSAYVQNAVSLNSALMTGARVVGPAVAGLLIILVGYSWTFAIDGISYIAVIAGLLMMRPSENRAPLVTPKGKGQIREGLRYVRTVPELWVPLVMIAFVGTFAFNFQTVIPLLVTRSLHSSDRTYTVLYSVLSVGSLLGALLAARRIGVTVRMITIAGACFGVAMLAMAVSPSVPIVMPAAIAVGLFSTTFMTSSTALMQLKASPAMRGRVLALQVMVTMGSTPVGAPILGWVSEHFGARA
ncbi:MAG TPA: MFS transporter, partial [Ilumatobacteraceae bacterium]|nr:MFS transporter [Ilumatobacteraceae bacterium]